MVRDPANSSVPAFPVIPVVIILCVLFVVALSAFLVYGSAGQAAPAPTQLPTGPAPTGGGDGARTAPGQAPRIILPEAPGTTEDMRREAEALRAKRDQLKRELEEKKAAEEGR